MKEINKILIYVVSGPGLGAGMRPNSSPEEDQGFVIRRNPEKVCIFIVSRRWTWGGGDKIKFKINLLHG